MIRICLNGMINKSFGATHLQMIGNIFFTKIKQLCCYFVGCFFLQRLSNYVAKTM